MVVLGIVAPIIILFGIIGIAGYNKIMVKWRDIIGGVGTAWLITMGIVLAIASVFGIIYAVIGENSNIIGLVLYIAIAVWGIYALVKAEKRCLTTWQRIILPFVCFALTMGFGWRIALKIFMNLPMESGSSGSLPSYIRQNGKWYSLADDYGSRALYRSYDGDELTLSRSEINNMPNDSKSNDID